MPVGTYLARIRYRLPKSLLDLITFMLKNYSFWFIQDSWAQVENFQPGNAKKWPFLQNSETQKMYKNFIPDVFPLAIFVTLIT